MAIQFANVNASGWTVQADGTRNSESKYALIEDTPAVSGVTGTVSDGNVLTITGTGFGTKTTAAPFRFDNFEGGTSGNLLTDSTYEAYDGGSALNIYTNADAYSGSQSSRILIPDAADSFDTAGEKGMNSKTVYFSLYEKTVLVTGDWSASQIVKYFRVNSYPDFYTSTPSLYITSRPSGTNWDMYIGWVNSAGTDQQEYLASVAMDSWTRLEVVAGLSSSPGASDGFCKVYFDGTLAFEKANGITLGSGDSSGSVIDNYLLPVMNDRAGASFYVYTDDFYADTTQARVEISLSSTWAAATSDKTIQIPSAWSGTSITATARGLTALGGGSKYLYVINADGNVNANGYAL